MIYVEIKSMSNCIKIYTDGACSGNPGPGGWGALIGFIMSKSSKDIMNDQPEVIELGGSEPQTTNNRMELLATINSLKFILNKIGFLDKTKIMGYDFTSVIVYTDSVYVIKGITQWVFGWKKKGWKNSSGQDVVNQDLWLELLQVTTQIQSLLSLKISWQYVRGHVGVLGNERCDRIAVAFSKNDYIELYKGSLENYEFDLNRAPKTEPLKESSFSTLGEKPKNFWYVVLKNGNITRYKTWSECEASVKGASNVKFKKVTSEAEESEVIKKWKL